MDVLILSVIALAVLACPVLMCGSMLLRRLALTKVDSPGTSTGASQGEARSQELNELTAKRDRIDLEIARLQSSRIDQEPTKEKPSSGRGSSLA